MPECTFCNIVQKKLPADTVFESDTYIVFKDIKPEAPVHLLIVPKKHIQSLAHVEREDMELAQEGVRLAKQIAETMNLSGYRVSMNVGEKAGQIVPHLHYHLLSW